MRDCKRSIYILTVCILMAMTASCGKDNSGALEKETEAVSETATETGATESSKPEADSAGSKADSSGSAGSTSAVYPDSKFADRTDDDLAASSANVFYKVRTTDGKSGDIVDMSIYKLNNDIVKIITEDYGSEGTVISEYYYDGDKVAYMKRYKTDIFGINSSYEEADLNDKEADYTIEVSGDAEEALKEAKKASDKTLLYGYAGDEQGGVLKNVKAELRNVAGDYTDETITDDDGYYSFSVPQKDDTYNISYIYDGCAVSTLNDIHILPGTPEYSLGRIFVAPEGQGVHDTDVYLLNINAKPPLKLKDGEYAAVLTSDDPSISLRLVNTDDRKSETGNQIKFDPSKSKNGYALFAEDSGYLSKEDMAGNIGRTYMTVTIYDKNGIAAAFREPSGRLGTLWKVCTINHNGDIAISGLMYTDSKGWEW